MEFVGHIIFLGEIRNAYETSVRKSETKRTFRKCRQRWEILLKLALNKS
jgi:hypothetical protein